MDNPITSIDDFFRTLLDINSPWKISDLQLDQHSKIVRVFIDFERGTKFDCPLCSTKCTVHDSSYRAWRHLDIIDYKLYLMIKIPRVKCSVHGVKTIREISWGRINTHFTHAFENSILHKAREMSVIAIAREVDEADKTLWRIINHHIEEMKKTQISFNHIHKICVDETSSKKGHKYVTVFTNPDTGNIVFVTEGKDLSTFEQFHNVLKEKHIHHKNIQNISMDMSKSFIAGAETYFPDAEITFDKFHVKKLLNEAVNKVRVEENKETEILKKTKYIWLKSESKLTVKQKEKLSELMDESNLNTVEAYRARLNFDAVWDIDKSKVEAYLKEWCKKVSLLNLKPMNDFVKTLKNHWKGIINIAITNLSNGISEGLNSIIQLAKSRARGFRNINNFINIIYLIEAGFEY